MSAPLGRGGASFVIVPILLVAAVAALCAALMRFGALPPALALHGALMLVAWGFVMPTGAIIARHFKVTPRQNYPAELDNPFWWRWHRLLQYGGLGLSAVALILALRATDFDIATWHGVFGLVVMALGGLQFLSACLRGSKGGPTDARADPADPATWRGDHFDMTPRRRLFEAWHKGMGWLALGLAGMTILLGIDLAGAPGWLVGLAGLVQSAALLALLDGHLRGRWTDTHAALWGPGAAPPDGRSPSRRGGKRCRYDG